MASRLMVRRLKKHPGLLHVPRECYITVYGSDAFVSRIA
jgi:hypothetical protein